MVDVIVLVKQMLDLEQIKANPSTGEPELKSVPIRMETVSENAVEAGVSIKEKYGGKVVAIIFGNEQSTAVMKKAYAMGVDTGTIITGYEKSDPSFTAKVLAEKIKSIPHDLVILGNQSADSISGLLSGKIAAQLGEPLIGNAVSIELEEKKAKVKRVLEDVNVVQSSNFPVIISVTQEINEPRLPPVLQIMQAGRKPMTVEKTTHTRTEISNTLSNKAPKSDRKRVIFEDAAKGIPELVKVIKEEMR